MDEHATSTTFGTPHLPSHVTAWMTVAEARAALVAAGQPALPVADHLGLIGLITIEALGGAEHLDASPPDPGAPVTTVMDWHLVQVPAEADQREVLDRFTRSAWRWLNERYLPSTVHEEGRR